MAGSAAIQRSVDSETAPPPSRPVRPSSARTRATRRRAIALIGGALLVVAIPSLVSNFTLGVVNLIGLAAITAMALNLLTGTCGLLSIGTAAFLAIGGFTAASLTYDLGLPLPLVVLAAGVVSAAVGGLIGVPALRFRGLYLVIATLALHYLIQYAAQKYQFARVGASGYPLKNPDLFGWSLDTRTRWFFVIAASLAASYALIRNLTKSRFGRAWKAIRDCESAAVAAGIRVRGYKILVFAISAFFIGMAGALTGYYVRVVEADSYPLELAIEFVAMIIIGGLGSQIGAVMGAVVVIGLPVVVNELAPRLPAAFPFSAEIQAHVFETEQILYGALIMLFILFEPNGLVAIARRVGAAAGRLRRLVARQA